MSVERYLCNCVNNIGNISDLLQILLDKTKSNSGVIFKHYFQKYTQLCSKNISTIVKVSNQIFNLQINNFTDFKTKEKIKNCISIPIFVQKKKIGLIILFNKPGGYTEEIINEITSVISLIQFYIVSEDKKKNDLDSKDLFIANISHEIRTPLNGVIGYNQLLFQTKLTPTQQKYLENMNNCSIQLMQIINDILDFSKLSSGKMTITNDCFNPKEIISTAFTALEQKINNKKQKCNINIHKSVPKIILSDKQKLIQILVNLLSNANKYSPMKSNIWITMKVKNNNLILSVRDNGIGIDKKFHNKIFSAFERIKCKDKICSGTGLGLAVTKKLANLLNGNIEIVSDLGKGSTFTVTTEFIKYKKDLENFNKDKEILKDKFVLIVDDNTDNRIFLSELLYTGDMIPIVCASALFDTRKSLRIQYGDNRYLYAK